MRCLVTAGNTREKIDEVRNWGNIFTGSTGYAIARALVELGPVDLLSSNRAHLAELAMSPEHPHLISGSPFMTHHDLKQALATLMGQHHYDAIFMTAAVSDYRPVRAYAVMEKEVDSSDSRLERWTVRDVQAGKVKSDHPMLAILGEKTEKLVDLFRTHWNYRGLLVKFKLEVNVGVEELLKIGENSRLASGADYLVANTLAMVGGSSPGAYLLGPEGHEWISRENLPRRLVALVREVNAKGHPAVQ